MMDDEVLCGQAGLSASLEQLVQFVSERQPTAFLYHLYLCLVLFQQVGNCLHHQPRQPPQIYRDTTIFDKCREEVQRNVRDERERHGCMANKIVNSCNMHR